MSPAAVLDLRTYLAEKKAIVDAALQDIFLNLKGS